MDLMVVVCFRGSAFVAWGGFGRLLRSAGLEGAGKGGGGLECSVVGLGMVVEACFRCCEWVVQVC